MSDIIDSATQGCVVHWVEQSFGPKTAADRKERAKRVLEEALELAQAEGVSANDAWHLGFVVYSRPPGEPAQEVGGIGVTLLAWGGAANVDVAAAINTEIDRVLAMPTEHWKARHLEKHKLGVASAPEAA